MAAYNFLHDAVKFNRHFLSAFRSLDKIGSCVRRISTKEISVEVEVGARPLRFSTGKLAFIADGSIVAQYGGTSVLVTASSSRKPTESGFLPLVVDYREKASAVSLIPSNFLRRELGPNEREILVSRCIDRSLRSLFMKGYLYDTQIMSNLLASDRLNDPDVTALNGASASLALSDIPWRGPVGAVRIGDIDGKLIVNPLPQDMEKSKLNLVVTSSEHKIIMLEGSAMEIDDDRFCEAVKLAHQESQPIINAIKELQSYAGKQKREFIALVPQEDLKEAVEKYAAEKLTEIFSNFSFSKLERDGQIFKLRDECNDKFQEEIPETNKILIEEAFHNTSRNVLRKNILEKKQRCDGRSFSQLRNIKCELNLFDTLHGSSLFDRGETQVFSTVTLGSVGSAAKVDNVSVAIGGDKLKRFMLHYEFPPFATNECKRPGRAGRRETGHGSIGERALIPVLPKEMPFTLRLTSAVLASNGSSSMASVCAGSLAMMDAGIPIDRHVAGTACGLVTSDDANDVHKTDIKEYQMLTDILGIEDYLGDMDFKIAGTRQGITCLQADFKVPGLPLHIIEEAVKRGSEDRIKVLDIMDNVINEARKTKKDNCPTSGIITVPIGKRGKLIGLGGMVIKGLEQELGITLTQINEEEYALFAPNKSKYDQAIKKIDELLVEKNIFEDLCARLEVGTIYQGKIVQIRPYGVMVEVFPDCPTVLLHSKHLDHKQVHPERLGFKEGDVLSFKYLGIDKNGRVLASRKAVLPPSTQQPRGPPSNRTHNMSKHKPMRQDKILDYLDEQEDDR